MCHFNFHSATVSDADECKSVCQARSGCNEYSYSAQYGQQAKQYQRFTVDLVLTSSCVATGCRYAKDAYGCCEDVSGQNVADFCTEAVNTAYCTDSNPCQMYKNIGEASFRCAKHSRCQHALCTQPDCSEGLVAVYIHYCCSQA